jgi:hypothetical protein
MKKIKKIKGISLGKLLGVVYTILGVVIGGLVTIFAILGKSVSGSGSHSGAIFLGIGAVVSLPIIYGILGFIFGSILGWLYNIAAKWTGGIEVEIE